MSRGRDAVLRGLGAAAFGYLRHVQGALVKEAIEVAVILNAPRPLRIEPPELPAPQPMRETFVHDEVLKGAVS